MFSTCINNLKTNFKQAFIEALTSAEIQKIDEQLQQSTQPIYPAPENILRAFDMFNIEDTKVVIIGQDPYHGPGEADGLCFSVPSDKKCPPSLRNVFSEINKDLPVEFHRTSTDLSDWARQGVLLINTAFTVEHNKPLSHDHIWKNAFKKLFKHISKKMKNVCFLLWGKKAEDYMEFINTQHNRVHIHTHPSPLSRAPFKGCCHFTRANDYLKMVGRKPIDWIGTLKQEVL